MAEPELCLGQPDCKMHVLCSTPNPLAPLRLLLPWGLCPPRTQGTTQRQWLWLHILGTLQNRPLFFSEPPDSIRKPSDHTRKASSRSPELPPILLLHFLALFPFEKRLCPRASRARDPESSFSTGWGVGWPMPVQGLEESREDPACFPGPTRGCSPWSWGRKTATWLRLWKLFQEKLQWWWGRQGKPGKCGSGGDLPHKLQAES